MLKRIRTVIFDLDGTLTVPVIDFNALRAKLGIAHGVSIAHALNLRPQAERDAGFAVVREAELIAAREARANVGACELVHALHQRGIGTALVTRNSREAVAVTLKRLSLEFDVAVTREFGFLKPAPEPVTEALRLLESPADATLMVGDYRDDIEAGRAAGTTTCLIMNSQGPPKWEADLYAPYPRELHQQMETAWK